MENLIYTKNQIENVLNIINSLVLKDGYNIINGQKLMEIVNILNSSIVNNEDIK